MAKETDTFRENLKKLLADTTRAEDKEKAMVLNALESYVCFGDIELPGAEYMPLPLGAKFPKDVVDPFCEFLKACGEPAYRVDAARSGYFQEFRATRK